MSLFIPVYRPKASQQSFFDREQRRERKRKRLSEGGEQDRASDELSDSSASSEARPPHPISLVDPHHVAGYPRDKPPLGGSFPHAAVDDRKRAEVSVEAELAQLKPALYIPKTDLHKNSGSLRRCHIDNLTVILHRCMLSGDWKRASRVWGLLLRTEMDGSGMDVRRHGRWGIGAEILLRRDQSTAREQNGESSSVDAGDDDNDHSNTHVPSQISDRSFKLAREYYERLILQYPYSIFGSSESINALVIYPALFNVWIYEVQDRFKQAMNKSGNVLEADSGIEEALEDDGGDHLAGRMQQQQRRREITLRGLDEARSIMQRLDDLISAPPYDASPAILLYRGFVGAWVADLNQDLSTISADVSAAGDPTSISQPESHVVARRYRVQARNERDRAKKTFQRLESLGNKLPDSVARYIADEDGSLEYHNGDGEDQA